MARDIRLGLVVRAIDQATGPLRRISAAVQRISRNTGLQKVGRAMVEVGRRFRGVVSEAGRTARRMGTIVGAAFAGLFLLTKKFAERGDNIAKTSKQIGIGVEQLQKYRHAFELGGAEIGDTDKALRYFSRRVGEANKGTGEAAEVFKAMGISLKDVNGESKPLPQLMGEVADKMAAQEDPAKKAYAAQLLFGRAGSKLIPTLNQGSEALRKAGEEAEQYGLMTEEQAKRSETFVDNLTRFKRSIEGLANAVTADLLPVFEPIILAMTDWLKKNREWLASKIRDGVKDLIQLVKDVKGAIKATVDTMESWRKSISETFPWLGRIIDKLADWAVDMGFVRVGLIGLGALLSVKLVAQIATFLGTVGKLGLALTGLVAASGPVGLTLIGLAALAGIVWLIYRNWDGIKKWWTDTWADFDKRMGISKLKADIGEWVTWFRNQWRDITTDPIKWWSGMWTDFKNMTGIPALKREISEWIEWFKQKWNELTSLGNFGGWWSDFKNRMGFGGGGTVLPGGQGTTETTPLGSDLVGGVSATQQATVGGTIRVEFGNAPMGTRVEEVQSDNPQVPIDTTMGYVMGS